MHDAADRPPALAALDVPVVRGKWIEPSRGRGAGPQAADPQTIAAPVTLAPPEAFSDERATARTRADCGCAAEPAGLGPKSVASPAGWPVAAPAG